MHPNAAVALRVAWRETGLPGLFRGTTSLLAREVRPAGSGHELQCDWLLTFTSAFVDVPAMSKHAANSARKCTFSWDHLSPGDVLRGLCSACFNGYDPLHKDTA